MKCVLIILMALHVSGCLIYLDHPQEQVVSGKVYWETGEAVSNANVTIWEGRSYITMFPISYPHSAKAVTDVEGYFEVVVKNAWPAGITANVNCGFGSVEIKESEISNVNIVVKPTCE